jgi:hypothetical protein
MEPLDFSNGNFQRQPSAHSAFCILHSAFSSGSQLSTEQNLPQLAIRQDLKTVNFSGNRPANMLNMLQARSL